ncbi:MAG: hypothetical protein B6244_13890 [Candidatus Cloacimonetes bacterium 4572_55]|nr:MAG: hypothetical protein B6244_13890 [Candidatus Cloacimonetes bacterium 4572_55]
MDRKPLVSVIIPIYNGEKYIEETLISLYKQTYPVLETIIIDDGSTDRSVSIVEKIDDVSCRRKIVSQQNGDVSRARNEGIKNAEGELIAFLDQDDLWRPDKIERQVSRFQKEPDIDLVFTDLVKFNDQGKSRRAKDKDRLARSLTDQNLFAKLSQKNVLMPSAVMVKKESFIRAGWFDESFKTCGDYEMWLRMAALGMKFRYLPEPLTLYRMHEVNASRNVALMHRDRIKAIQKAFAMPGLTLDQKKWEPRALAAGYIAAAHSFFSTKQYQNFLETLAQAWTYDKKIIGLKIATRYLRSRFYVWKNTSN